MIGHHTEKKSLNGLRGGCSRDGEIRDETETPPTRKNGKDPDAWVQQKNKDFGTEFFLFKYQTNAE